MEGFKQANCRLSNGHNTLSASLELEEGVGVGSEVVTNSSQDGDKRGTGQDWEQRNTETKDIGGGGGGGGDRQTGRQTQR